MKKYERASQTNRYEYIRITQKTNCTDKIDGHSYEWIFREHPEHDAIQKQFKFVVSIVRCVKCGKVSQST